MVPIIRRLHANNRALALAALLPLVLCACTHLAVEDCGGEVLGDNKPRIRSSHYRMFLADLPAASERFVAHAAMSSLAYAEDANCGTAEGESKISASDRSELNKILQARGWSENRNVEWFPSCEDDVGLFARVFERVVDGRKEVVLAFRGTWGVKDWAFGNAHWLTRHFPMDDQYSRARQFAGKVFEHYSRTAGAPVRFYTTGHSLGGGLAQHILYANPRRVVQAVAFDPSSVTGFADQSIEDQIAGCSCDPALPSGETRIYRVYDAYEVLANLRIFHKIFFTPERHIQEVRFPNARSHSMLGLTKYLSENAQSASKVGSVPWFQGTGDQSPGLSCTKAFVDKQMSSCSVQASADSWSRCPQ